MLEIFNNKTLREKQIYNLSPKISIFFIMLYFLIFLIAYQLLINIIAYLLCLFFIVCLSCYSTKAYIFIFSFCSTDYWCIPSTKAVPRHLLNKWKNWDKISWQLKTIGTGHHNETISDPSITSDLHLLKI